MYYCGATYLRPRNRQDLAAEAPPKPLESERLIDPYQGEPKMILVVGIRFI
jgi:hypothetical protein